VCVIIIQQVNHSLEDLKMAVLKSLSFTAMPKAVSDPIQIRRAKLMTRLEEQKQLLGDPNLIRIVQRAVKENGEKRIVNKEQRVRPWWRTDAAGHLFMTIKFGSRPVDFEKGKSAIAVPSKDKLPAVIDMLIAAVRAGELDDILAQASKQRTAPKPRKVA
jgi:hypothetical protein